MAIRQYQPSDLAILHAANEASVPGVSPETPENLAKWIDLATCFVATDAGNAPLGFLTLIAPGTHDYPSDNLRWFETYCARSGKTLIYVDRIALLPEARGQRLGEALYQVAFAHFSDHDEIGCEVNTEPPNPGSHRFHERLGFQRVGERTYEPGAKAVAFYARALS